ncbi:hypothetical protein [Sphingobium sp. HDIP04]|uniref:hypothetical protein n=1 Tax=Sphingobium sp. HDIP04 TaxID=428994 RepID=UPI0003878BB5|nr:hypothetical protein [Sphingobium sp. HDIP04]EQB03881.1 hypothetical protein L286_10985 [Sphingobium sp. HDIP04]
MDLPTPGEWVAEKWSAKESQVVALCGEKRTLICAGVLPADAKVIVQAKGAADAITKLEAEKAELVSVLRDACAWMDSALPVSEESTDFLNEGGWDDLPAIAQKCADTLAKLEAGQ